MSSTEIVHVPHQGVAKADFMPLLTVEDAVERKRSVNQFIERVMKEGEDYGKIPGMEKSKPTLLKPGAEKLCSIFGLAPRYVAEVETEDWTGRDHAGEPLFYYRYRCQLYRGDKFLGEGIGSANSWESKYRYRWVREEQLLDQDKSLLPSRGGKQTLFEPMFAFDKRETTGKYGKPEEHWQRFEQAVADGSARKVTRQKKAGGDMVGWEIDVDTTLYRIPNPDVAEVVNTCQKIAQKRALIAAVLVVTNCSDAFTQDLEDMSTEGIDTGGHSVGTQAAADHVAQTKLNGGKLHPLLSGAYAAIDKDNKAFRKCCDELAQKMSDKGGSAGAAKFDEISDRFVEKYPQGTGDKAVLKAFIKELFEAWEALEEYKADQMPLTPEVVK